MSPSFPPTILTLTDSAVFRDYSIGAADRMIGEVAFNTAITGYQEILVDPGHPHQIVTLTYPHIDNVGVNREDVEATEVHAAGLIIKDLPILASNFREKHVLSYYLKDEEIVVITEIDTRKLTRILRGKGAQNGCVPADEDNVQKAIDLSHSSSDLLDMDLAKVVPVTESYEWTQIGWALGRGYGKQEAPKYHVVAYGFGVKFNTLRTLAERGYRVTVVPVQTSAVGVLAHSPDGVFLSDGPDDPEPCNYAIAATKEFLECHLPTFGICLGHQIMGLAVGAKTLKMKTNHYDANYPVKGLQDGRAVITSQSHDFAVDPGSLPTDARVTHVSLFDDALRGFELTNRPAFCFQGHPEASPGPHDITYLFDRFAAVMDAAK